MDRAKQTWYAVGMTKKIAVSLPDHTLERAKTAVRRGKAPNVSNYIALLIDQESAAESFEQMIADFLRDSGATEKQIRAAERQAATDFERAGLTPKIQSSEPQRSKHREEAPRKAG